MSDPKRLWDLIRQIALTPSGERTINYVIEQEDRSLQRVAKSSDPGELEIAIKAIAQVIKGFSPPKDKQSALDRIDSIVVGR